MITDDHTDRIGLHSVLLPLLIIMHFCSGRRTPGVAPKIGLSGSGMRVTMKAGYGMTELSIAGFGLKICRWERDFLILTKGRRDSFKIVGGMWDEKREITRYGRYTENCVSNQAGLR